MYIEGGTGSAKPDGNANPSGKPILIQPMPGGAIIAAIKGGTARRRMNRIQRLDRAEPARGMGVAGRRCRRLQTAAPRQQGGLVSRQTGAQAASDRGRGDGEDGHEESGVACWCESMKRLRAHGSADRSAVAASSVDSLGFGDVIADAHPMPGKAHSPTQF